MSASALNICEKLIKGYVKAPPSLKEQAITTLAIQLCQNVELKKDIIFESEPLRLKYIIESVAWDLLIEKRSTDMCEKLPLPPALRNLLIVRMRTIALELFSWNRQQVMFNLSPLFADSLLTPSDWTVEMRLDEKKIAERLVQDERIPVCQRYKMACLQCLESFIHSLWDQIPPESREDLFRDYDCELVVLWSYKSSGLLTEVIRSEDLFWYHIVKCGVREGSMSTVFRCWDKLHMSLRQEVVIDAAMGAVASINSRSEKNSFMYRKRLSSPAPYTDILCFLLTQMSEEQKAVFFQIALQNTHHNVLVCILQWPYLDLLLPIIKKLWNILPEAKYGHLLLTIADNYSDESEYLRRNGYVDYDYGSLMIELLEETPDHFKRYVFGDSYHTVSNSVENGEILNTVIRKETLKIPNIKIFQHIWQHVTLKEKRSFLRSEHGKSFCCFLARKRSWDLLNSILRECLSEDNIAMYKKQILKSDSGKDRFFGLLQVNEERLNSWLNWGFPSNQEIFQFIFKIYFRDRRLNFDDVGDFGIEIDCLDNLIERYSPSEDARRKFKTRFFKIYSKDVCIHFVIHSKWQEIDRFLTRGFPSEGARKRFKKWFVKECAMFLCEYHIARSKLQDAEQFLIWCFRSEDDVEQFRQEFFFFSGVHLQLILFDDNSEDLDRVIKWFRLSPEAILKFKKELLFRSYYLSYLFTVLSNLEKSHIRRKGYSDFMLQKIAISLRWGLADEETAMAFKDASKLYLMNFSFSNNKVRQWVQQNWEKLISDRLSDLSIERKHETQQNGELSKQGKISSL